MTDHGLSRSNVLSKGFVSFDPLLHSTTSAPRNIARMQWCGLKHSRTRQAHPSRQRLSIPSIESCHVRLGSWPPPRINTSSKVFFSYFTTRIFLDSILYDIQASRSSASCTAITVLHGLYILTNPSSHCHACGFSDSSFSQLLLPFRPWIVQFVNIWLN